MAAGHERRSLQLTNTGFVSDLSDEEDAHRVRDPVRHADRQVQLTELFHQLRDRQALVLAM